MHATVLKKGEKVNLYQCISCCDKYHCPFCETWVYKPAPLYKVKTHVEIHLKTAIHEKDFIIIRCKLKCRDVSHFHCCYCSVTIIRKAQFTIHLTNCREKKEENQSPQRTATPMVLIGNTSLPSVSAQTAPLLQPQPPSEPHTSVSTTPSTPLYQLKVFKRPPLPSPLSTVSSLPSASAQTAPLLQPQPSSKPAYEMLPSLHLGHTVVKPVLPGQINKNTKRLCAVTRENTAPALSPAPSPLGVPEGKLNEEAETDDASRVHDNKSNGEANSNDNTIKQQECHLCRSRQAEINRLLEENRRLKEELVQKSMDEDSFKDDDTKAKYYTGLPSFALVMGVLTQLLPSLPHPDQKLSPFQMFLSTMMRLRLNLPIQHIAYLFSVDQKTVSTTFRNTIGAMFTYLKPLVQWPERRCLQATMPHQFVETFGDQVAVIVDCFEIRTKHASQLKAKEQTFSHNKHYQTLKYLIGITPRGYISFISKGWRGNVSDKHVTENSGLLNKLVPGDLVLAEHGFDITDSVGLMCAEVQMPALTKGAGQLVARDVEETRRIAHLRVHVERVIGYVHKKYTILNGIAPVSMILPCQSEDMMFLDKIVTVCCALTNMCPSIVIKL